MVQLVRGTHAKLDLSGTCQVLIASDARQQHSPRAEEANERKPRENLFSEEGEVTREGRENALLACKACPAPLTLLQFMLL
jgi:hypothetical protein